MLSSSWISGNNPSYNPLLGDILWLTLTFASHSVGLQIPPLLTQPSKSREICLSTSSIFGIDKSRGIGPADKNEQW